MSDFPTGPGKNVLEQVRWAQQHHLAPKTAESSQQQYLTFHLDQEWYALPVYQLVEVLAPPKITRVPSIPDHILGVMNFRGEVLSVLDVKRFFGLPESECKTDQAIIVVEEGEVRTGLLVDEIGDLVSLTSKHLSEEPILAGTSQRAFFLGAAHWGEILLSVIDLDGILQSEGMTSRQG
jgi:purine-binding chemotaxis protein CheW